MLEKREKIYFKRNLELRDLQIKYLNYIIASPIVFINHLIKIKSIIIRSKTTWIHLTNNKVLMAITGSKCSWRWEALRQAFLLLLRAWAAPRHQRLLRRAQGEHHKNEVEIAQARASILLKGLTSTVMRIWAATTAVVWNYNSIIWSSNRAKVQHSLRIIIIRRPIYASNSSISSKRVEPRWEPQDQEGRPPWEPNRRIRPIINHNN